MDIIRFIKDWTLPVAMGTGAVLYLLFAFTPQLDGAAMAMGPFFDTILPLFMFLILFVTSVRSTSTSCARWHGTRGYCCSRHSSSAC